jgi:hypothetical protein
MSASENLSKCSGLLLRTSFAILAARTRHLISVARRAAFSVASRLLNSSDILLRASSEPPLLSCRADFMGGKNSVNNRCRIAKHFRRNENRSCAYFIGTSSHCVFSNTIQNLPCSGPRTRSRWGIRTRYDGVLALDHLRKMKIAVMVRQLDLEGNAPHDRPGVLVGHLVGNRASFLCTEAPMLRVPDELAGWWGIKATGRISTLRTAPALRAINSPLDHLVGAREQCRWHLDATPRPSSD